MTDTRWDRLNALFEQALERPAAERAAFLAAACAGDEELIRHVERLVSAHERLDHFLEGAGIAIEAPASPTPRAEGREIGPWRILREVGHGGMGTVYLAERADRQFERQVALKLIRRGMDSDLVLRRFETERQILAGLDHPNIARLYDGGTTSDGLPYFVMEYIEGDPIDRHCDARRRTISERLELFRQVCAAVSFAHQHLVVHRDLKPSNIMVTADGTAKLLDFGLARILHEDEAGRDTRTATGLQIMTPEYASPEQMQGLLATTLSDVYSLGVMLYELLCGRSPYRFTTRSLPQVLEVLNTAEPSRPSSRLGDAPKGAPGRAGAEASLSELAAARGTSPERLRRRLQGDLDMIVLKAMHKDPLHRYASVEQFSEDIRRHLAGLPVLVRPDTFAYRARKFVRRNRIAVTAAAVVGVTLVAGVITTTWQARRAREAQARAERRFEDLRTLARSVLFDYHDAIKDLAGSTPIRERLVSDGLAYLDALVPDSRGDPSLQRDLAAGYVRLGDVQGGTMFANLGNTQGALESYAKAHKIYAALLAADSNDVSNRRGYANNLIRQARLQWELGDLQQALANARRATPMLRSLVHEVPDDVELTQDLIRALDTGGLLLQDSGNPRAAIEQHREQLGFCERLLARHPGNLDVRRGVAVATDHIATAYLTLGDYPTALTYSQRTIEERRKLAADYPLNADYQRALAVSYYNDGEILGRLGRFREALASYRREVDIVQALARADPRNEQYRGDIAYGWIRIGDMQAELGQLPSALASYRASLEMRAADVEADPTNLWKRASLIEAHAKLAKTLAQQRDAAALTHVTQAAGWMERTTLDPADMNLRTFFAMTYADLGMANAAMASDGASSQDTRRSRWSDALDLYRRSAALWQDLRARGLLQGSDAHRPGEVDAEIARCSAALVN